MTKQRIKSGFFISSPPLEPQRKIEAIGFITQKPLHSLEGEKGLQV
jgi:hypothetical protein